MRDAAGQARCSDAACYAGAGASGERSGPGRALGQFGDEEGVEQCDARRDGARCFRCKRQDDLCDAGKYGVAAGVAVKVGTAVL